MPPKKAVAASTNVYVVISGNTISVHASSESANAAKQGDARVEMKNLVGGSVIVDPVIEEKRPAKAKAAKTEDAPKANTTAKKSKPAGEQRAANVENPKSKKGQVNDEDLPDNVQALLKGTGSALSGMAIVVTGIPPVIGRKNAEKLVEAYGGKLSKSLSKNTSLVVIGNDAGPAKLEKIEELNVKTVDEDEFVEMIEAGAGKKRSADEDDEEDEDEEEEEEEKPKKSKKQKK